MRSVIEKGGGVRHFLAGVAIVGLAVSLFGCDRPSEAPSASEWQEEAEPVQPDRQEQVPVAPAQQQESAYPTVSPE